ncbi:dipeptide epimerase [Haloferax mediterranei ATCC 33500]|uniref:Chloromuconate cycloisomerase n=1 Tax=Haloferax mediterranei (strain ATCC 33500 / DSM 1411 / JCM 8866 / NBRC 14739 / NCIMB 2177 / R-4) TaxID=523841 RepID=I3R7X8_HALMT|nr:dipeptide epimerase [Haloferax mediterranei]AFK20338.1 mandelate racemase-like protein / muconate lactonizing enzyme-like protein [Haloferax mediterranei ATCC 33500]AHZ23706.1 chloromuconate cycloisomerase [Haloferax mediterranei ATCC 33500]ELZ99194.1 mandelate racemase-like protein / muconate lactonizing enzyme-like protein [Haloferax mediterranei ATCC 33500]MDX5986906.1 dipeptide epimerase [Haloferax mediterranei ATCC 33500]QCQ76228.1 dipeptide epimerase [Haloferax mediterranei ATCC 33500
MLSTEFERISMPLAEPFGISRGVQTEAENVVVRIEDEGGMTGVGAAAPSSHYGETADTVEAVLPDLLAVVEEVGDPHAIDRIERRMAETVRRNPAARTAVSIALHDLAAKRLGVPLYRLWGLDADRAPTSSFTIGLDDLDTMREKTNEAYEAGYDVLKVKLGTDRDKAIIEAVRDEAPGVRIRVDANEAWTPREAVEMSEFLAGYGVEFVEQPVPAEDYEGLQFVYDHGALPIAADESCITADDIPKIADRVDIANLKLMKCGGLVEAKRAIHTARAHGLEVMLGCMIETNAAIAAGCHLTPLLDYADLDGSLLLANDPYEGVPMPNGAINLTELDRAGTGAQLQ